MDHLIELYQQGSIARAREIAAEMANEGFHHPLPWKILGAVSHQEGDYEASVNWNVEGAERFPNDAEIKNNLGVSLNAIERWNEAKIVFLDAIKIAPEYSNPYSNLGISLRNLGDLSGSEDYLSKAITLNPNNPDTVYHLATTLFQLGRVKDAEEIYLKAIDLAKNFYEPYIGLSQLLITVTRYEDAEKLLLQAISLEPNRTPAYNSLGILFKTIADYESAESYFKKALALDHNMVEALNNLGLVYVEKKKTKEAERLYENAIAINPLSPYAYANLGDLRLRQGLLGDAEKNLRKSIELDPNLAAPFLSLAVLAHYACLPEEVDFLKKVVALDPTNLGLRSLVMLAVREYLNSNYEQCNKLLQQSVTIHHTRVTDAENDRSYHNYLSILLKMRASVKFDQLNKPLSPNRNIFVIGDSHCLPWNDMLLHDAGHAYRCNSILIMGCKQWHLRLLVENQFKTRLGKIFLSIPPRSRIILTVGEIDIRLDDGILPYVKKNSMKDVTGVISETIKGYFEFLAHLNLHTEHRIIIQGVPCLNKKYENNSEAEIIELAEAIKVFNSKTHELCIKAGYEFLDVWSLTNRGDGVSNGKWHIDDHHLSPLALQQGWHSHRKLGC